MEVRKATEKDVDELWMLMKELAVFEKYIDSFAITPEVVRECGFKKKPPDFYSMVAEDDGHLVGMLVYYMLPYTAENRPAIYLKELYVSEACRGRGVGDGLMRALRDEAKRKHCKTIKWTVAPWNDRGMQFYKRLGASENTDWLNFEWDISGQS